MNLIPRIMRRWLFLSLVLPQVALPGQEPLSIPINREWQLQRDRDGIQVSTGEVIGSDYAAVKTTAVVHDVALNTLVAILRDKESCEDWVSRCEDARVIEQVSDQEWIAYTRTDLPFPFQDRWLLSRSVWKQNPDTFEVTIHSQAIAREFAEDVGGVRVTDSQTSWWLTPMESGDIRLINVTHVEPETPLPAWITNRLLTQGPFRTMKNLVTLSQAADYSGQSVSFIEEPEPNGN